MRDYELMLVLNPEIAEENMSATVDKVKALVTNRGGEILETVDSAPWGRRRLAYPIKDFRDGYYVVVQMKFDPAQTADLERELQLTEDVIRYLLVRKSD